MELVRSLRSRLLAIVLLLLVAVALVNLMHVVLATTVAGETARPLPVPAFRGFLLVDAEVTSLVAVVLAVLGGGVFAVAYLKYRPEGRFPYEELLFLVLGTLLFLAFVFYLAGQEAAELQEEEADGDEGPGDATDPGGEEGDPGGTGPVREGLLIFRLGPRAAGFLIALFILSGGLFLLRLFQYRRASRTLEAARREAREAVAETLETGIDRLRRGESVGSVIQECYRDLLHLLRDRGVEAGFHLTAREVEGRARHVLGLSLESARALRGLFEEARYSDHELLAGDRDRALEALERARTQLEA